MSCAAAVVLSVVGAAAAAALRWPLAGLLAYLWLDFMRPHDTYVELRAARPMLVLGVVTLAATAWRERRRLGDTWRALRPVAALTAVVAASALISVDRSASAAALVHMGKMLALVWLIERLVRDEAGVRAVLWVLALSLGVLAVGAIVQANARDLLHEFRPELVIEGPPGLHDGAFRDNNDLARVLALSVPLWWVLAALPASRWRRVAAGAGLLVSVAAIECTFSRSGFLALLIGIGGVALSVRPLWRGAAVWLGIAVALLALSPRPYIERIETMGAPRGETSVQGRLSVWRDAVPLVVRRPLLGQGAGTFRAGEGGTPAVRRPSHNILLEVAVETGLVGLAAYGWVVLDTLMRLYRLQRVAATAAAWVRTAATGVSAALLAYLAAGLALSGPFASPLFVLVGLSLALQGDSPQRAQRVTEEDLTGP